MPFTFSHPAVFIPLGQRLKKKLSVTGLIMGSMVPDFEFFLKMKTGENIGHHWYGILIFDIPVAIVCCYVFHVLLRDNLIHHSPEYFYQRFNKWLNFDWSNYTKENKLALFLSIILGIFSHLFLDAFTHADGFFVAHNTFLKSEVTIFGMHTHTYMLLQVIESVVGLYFIFDLIKSLPRTKSLRRYDDELFWLPLAILIFTIFLLRLISLPQYLSFWDLFMAGMGSLIYSSILIGLTLKSKKNINQEIE
jgi:Domain of unknown function (DUF4184)